MPRELISDSGRKLPQRPPSARSLFALALAGLPCISCDRSPKVADPTSAITLSPRLERAADLTDSVWLLAAAVHVEMVTIDGRTLLDDTVLFSSHGVPAVRTPVDQGVVVTVDGLDNHLAVVWSGKQTLPPGTRDTSFKLTVDGVTSPIWDSVVTKGSANTPTLDSADVAELPDSSWDRPLRVYLSCVTPGAQIHYTLDGSYPTDSSPVYSGSGILVDSTRVLEAIAIAQGWINSAALFERFRLRVQPVSVVSTSANAWDADTFDQALTIKLSSATPGAQIRYTLDGSAPSLSSPLYQDSLVVDSSGTLNAIAYEGKAIPSAPMPSRKIVIQAQPVTLTSTGVDPWTTGTYDRILALKLATKSTNAEIHYSLDGTTPTRSSPLYKDSIVADSGCTLVATAFVGRSRPSTPLLDQKFVLQAQPVTLGSASTYSWAFLTYDRPVTITLSTSTAKAQIRYTLDGTTPTRSSPLYANGITIDTATNLQAVAFFGRSIASSPVFSQSFKFQPQSPSATPNTAAWTTDTYDRPITATLASQTANAEIHYTLDGSTPTKSSPLYSTPIPIDSNCTLKSIAYAPISPIGSPLGVQTFRFQVQPVYIGADANAGWPPFLIGMHCPTPGVQIRYARHGNLPTADSSLYTDSLRFTTSDDSATYKAIAIDPKHPQYAPSTPSGGYVGWSIPWNPSLSYGTLVDSRDGQSYKTLQLGSQTWMAENLRYAPVFGDSDCLKYTDYSGCPSGGRKYDWATAMGIDGTYDNLPDSGSGVAPQGICPSGWHVPSQGEWKKLTDTTLTPSTAATTLEIDFRIESDQYTWPYSGFYWASTEVDSATAAFVEITNPVIHGGFGKSTELSLRCIKN